MKKLRIVFMGTPEFAVGILDTIYKQTEHEIVGVITATDKPAGRGQKIKYSAVKDYAIEKNLLLLQPSNLKEESFLLDLKSLNANLFIVVAFRMLPKAVWEIPHLGTFNLHASLLPNYRGAAPINWAIINGESQTGVTTFFIDDKIDTGAIILSKSIQLDENENAGQLHDRLMNLGGLAVSETLELISKGEVVTRIQEDSEDLQTAFKLNKENCKIDFNKSLYEVYNQIRGLSPYPAAWCYFKNGRESDEITIKLLDVKVVKEEHDFKAGAVFASKKELKFALDGGFIKIVTLQFPGKKKMTSQELLNGVHIFEEAIVY